VSVAAGKCRVELLGAGLASQNIGVCCPLLSHFVLKGGVFQPTMLPTDSSSVNAVFITTKPLQITANGFLHFRYFSAHTINTIY